MPNISSSEHWPCFTLNTPTLWWLLTKVCREEEVRGRGRRRGDKEGEGEEGRGKNRGRGNRKG